MLPQYAKICPFQPALFKQALELGATPISAFTDKVTHLIANDHGGAKYMVSALGALINDNIQ
jgi:hypothetical protein